MRLKTYNAPSIQAAMQMVRDEMGEDAVIVSTSRDTKGKGVIVTVAQDPEADSHGPATIVTDSGGYETPVNYTGLKRPTTLPDYILRDIEQILIRNGVMYEVVEKLLDSVRGQPHPSDDTDESLRQLLTVALRDVFTFEPHLFQKHGYRHILIGAPGVGKTLTAAKLAARVVKAKGNLRLVTTDIKRAGAVDQIAAYAEAMGISLEVAESRAEMKTILKSLSGGERLIVDTSGANPFDFHELKELAEFANLLELEPILVFPAGLDPNDAAEIAQAFAFIGVERILFTRVDLAKRYGALLNAAHAAGLAITYASAGEKVMDDFAEIDAAQLARHLMEYRTKRH